MLTGEARTLTKSLDTYTPCIFESHKLEQMHDNYLRQEVLVDKILYTSLQHFTKRQQIVVVQALYFSAECHAGVRRKDDITPYFMHLLEVANILFEMNVYDFKLLIAAILHDVVEDTAITLDQIRKLFGSAIRNIVDLMTKHPDLVRKANYFLSMKKEVDLNIKWRVIALKFADRIHSMMTLHLLTQEKRKLKLTETHTEFPLLYKSLASAVSKLRKKGTIKKINYMSLPFRLNNRLIYEMERHL